eukprot:TRINITY_DN50632_c0_g1_i1.p1 TRINITY_DN50632_c0_g1~~TRINITY_DN50632_c0_g1_i1.p1  ORF type:complete len:462 (+),score=103.42 TRINITY_DN50632_c0_g1_i1:127-1386(+)
MGEASGPSRGARPTPQLRVEPISPGAGSPVLYPGSPDRLLEKEPHQEEPDAPVQEAHKGIKAYEQPTFCDCSPEQRVRVSTMAVCCICGLFLFIFGAVLWTEYQNEGLPGQKHAAWTVLLVGVIVAVLLCCLGCGLSSATEQDISYKRLKLFDLRRQDRQNVAITPPGSAGTDAAKRKRNQRFWGVRKRDLLFSRMFQMLPCFLVLPTVLLFYMLNAGEIRTIIPKISGALCTGTTLPATCSPEPCAVRRCTYWGGKEPRQELYLRNCSQYNAYSCCSPSEVSALFSVDNWLSRVHGDKFFAGECHRMLEALACWVCNPDQMVFYRDSKVRVCTSMCNTVHNFCSSSTLDHETLTFGEMFADGAAMCRYLDFEVADCDCHESYPNQWYDTYSTVNFGQLYALRDIAQTPAPASNATTTG